MMPQRIQLKRTKGWRMPPNTVKVDRSTKWGNPFKPPLDGTVEQCVRMFRNYVSQSAFLSFFDLNELRGKNLACWCKPGVPCHADVLIELANS